MKQTVTLIKKMIQDGLLHIVGAGTINKIISLCSGMIIVRILSKTEYGIYSYVLNIVGIFMLLNGLGTPTGIMQYGCELSRDRKQQRSLIKFGFLLGLGFNFIIALCLIIYASFFPKSLPDTDRYFLFAAFMPLTTYISECIFVVMRINQENKKYGSFSLLNSILTFSCILMGAWLMAVTGAITFRYIAFIILTICCFISFPELTKCASTSVSLQKQNKNGFIKFSILSCANNSISHLFYSADLFIIGILISQADIIAAYKVSTTIPLSLTFFTAAVVQYIYPKFVRNQNNRKWIAKNYKTLLLYLTALNGLITILGITFAPSVISIVFGKQYVEQATLPFRILMVGFLISSTFRMPSGNILDMLHLIKPNFYISIISGFANIVLDIILIQRFSYIGAAIATTLTYFFYALLSNIIIIRYLQGKTKA